MFFNTDAAAGYSGKVAEEIEKLRRMAQRGDRQRLGTLMKDISQIVAEEVVEEQPGLKPRVRPRALLVSEPWWKRWPVQSSRAIQNSAVELHA